MYSSYGPYSKESNDITCTSGSIERVDWLFQIAKKYDLKIMLDLHGIKDSQNGFDNSGQTLYLNISGDHFSHWGIRGANWIGKYNLDTQKYDFIDSNSIYRSLKILEKIFSIYSDRTKYSNLYGIEILNEPWEKIPEKIIKNFYQDTFDIFTQYMDSSVRYIIHDSFRPWIWTNFELKSNYKSHEILIDTHQYTAWNSPYDSFEHLKKSNQGWKAPQTIYPFVIGEFSLSIDNCEMWLNGFQDNLEGYPKYNCAYKPCPNLEIGNNNKLILNASKGPWGCY